MNFECTNILGPRGEKYNYETGEFLYLKELNHIFQALKLGIS